MQFITYKLPVEFPIEIDICQKDPKSADPKT